MISEEKLKELAEVLAKAIPDGQVLNILTVLPKVGCADSEAQPVIGFVLGRSEDCERFRQVLDRGISEYQNEIGLTAALFRERVGKGAGDAPAPSVKIFEAVSAAGDASAGTLGAATGN
ncbi:hypothetical protein [Ralstonia sp. ASV6]|uniref:hypothetical protein n=1 Tax=Ralstonia sp. ASV6 TaxID=2795124 RepID=UPI0018EB8E7D|nr:hypothetical protein [Ralstonia sp. ASV6]